METDNVVIAIISGLFMLTVGVISARSNKRGVDVQAETEEKRIEVQEQSASSEAFETAAGIYMNSINRLEKENADLRSRVAELESLQLAKNREITELSKKIQYLERLIRDDHK